MHSEGRIVEAPLGRMQGPERENQNQNTDSGTDQTADCGRHGVAMKERKREIGLEEKRVKGVGLFVFFFFSSSSSSFFIFPGRRSTLGGMLEKEKKS